MPAPAVDILNERRVAMPRASWRGFLRLSLVSCPVYLSPATTRAKPIRLHQVWQPALVDVDEDELSDRSAGLQDPASSSARMPAENGSLDGDPSPAATRIGAKLPCCCRSLAVGNANPPLPPPPLPRGGATGPDRPLPTINAPDFP